MSDPLADQLALNQDIKKIEKLIDDGIVTEREIAEAVIVELENEPL